MARRKEQVCTPGCPCGAGTDAKTEAPETVNSKEFCFFSPCGGGTYLEPKIAAAALRCPQCGALLVRKF